MIRGISLDLDDTLWPIGPCIDRAESALDDWLMHHAPEVAARYPRAALRAERDRVWRANPHLGHDLSRLRRLSLGAVFANSGIDPDAIEPAMVAFDAGRNRVDFYDDALPALHWLAERWPLVSLSNGNADLDAVGVGEYFRARVYSREVGCAKPERLMFERAAQALGVAPGELLHVGDDPVMDVEGARAAGCIAVWLDRGDHVWPATLQQPVHRIASLAGLAALLPDLSGSTPG